MSQRYYESLLRLPPTSDRPIAVHLTADAERKVRFGHPWLYDQSIRKQSRQGTCGDLAALYDRRNRFLAIGFFDPFSPIRVRILERFEPRPINPAWFKAKVLAALKRRQPLTESSTTGFRLIHGENDSLPGLIVDGYGDTLVLKVYTAAWSGHLRNVTQALFSFIPVKRVVLRLSRFLQESGHLGGVWDGLILWGPQVKKPIVFLENGLEFEVDPLRGQKTGFFLDQRENRLRVEKLASGRSVLDAFAYTGAFSVYAARGAAKEIVSIDVAAEALEAAKRNMARNPSTARHSV
ncbi:MAG: class I SAM-dependent methyltransferase, partial [Candidatus Omnitrophica bacterium]|nr:class I SAM-dependent methyltransferase [Candidatus Omnitrophota bacterium]